MTSPYDQIRADVAAAEAADQAKDTQHAADQATIAADEAQIAELEAELHPTPPPGKTVFGVNASSKTQHDTFGKLFAPVGVWRLYRTAGQRPTPPTAYPRGNGERFILSTKVKPQDAVTGRYDADFTSLAQWMTADDIYCFWHEPEDDVENGHFTVDEYRAGWAHVGGIFRKANPAVKLAPILMNATFSGLKGRRWQDFVPDDFDVMGVDAYAAGSIGVPVGQIPTMFDKAIAAAGGKPWAVGETGVGQKVSGQARLDALTLLAKTIRSKGAVAAAYFVGLSNSNEWAVDAAGAAAVKAGAGISA